MPTQRVSEAVVLAAGDGDRFATGGHGPKLLYPIRGVPLIARTLRTLAASGIDVVHLVLGFEAERVRAEAAAAAAHLDGLNLQFNFNAHWRQENGLSVLAARNGVASCRFAIIMGDHVFDPQSLAILLKASAQPGESLLAIDRLPSQAVQATEATRVRLDDDLVTGIGKEISPYDALDTGLFVCDRAIFEAIEQACANSDTSLTGGVQKLAAQRKLRGLDIAGPWWDVDCIEDVAAAETMLGQSD